MINNICFVFLCIIVYSYLCLFISWIGLQKYLDKKTRYEDDKFTVLNKYNILFIYCHVFCLLFIKQIKHSRKIDFYKTYIKNREFVYTSYDLENDKNYFLYKRLLKLEKLK